LILAPEPSGLVRPDSGIDGAMSLGHRRFTPRYGSPPANRYVSPEYARSSRQVIKLSVGFELFVPRKHRASVMDYVHDHTSSLVSVSAFDLRIVLALLLGLRPGQVFRFYRLMHRIIYLFQVLSNPWQLPTDEFPN